MTESKNGQSSSGSGRVPAVIPYLKENGVELKYVGGNGPKKAGLPDTDSRKGSSKSSPKPGQSEPRDAKPKIESRANSANSPEDQRPASQSKESQVSAGAQASTKASSPLAGESAEKSSKNSTRSEAVEGGEVKAKPKLKFDPAKAKAFRPSKTGFAATLGENFGNGQYFQPQFSHPHQMFSPPSMPQPQHFQQNYFQQQMFMMNQPHMHPQMPMPFYPDLAYGQPQPHMYNPGFQPRNSGGQNFQGGPQAQAPSSAPVSDATSRFGSSEPSSDMSSAGSFASAAAGSSSAANVKPTTDEAAVRSVEKIEPQSKSKPDVPITEAPIAEAGSAKAGKTEAGKTDLGNVKKTEVSESSIPASTPAGELPSEKPRAAQPEPKLSYARAVANSASTYQQQQLAKKKVEAKGHTKRHSQANVQPTPAVSSGNATESPKPAVDAAKLLEERTAEFETKLRATVSSHQYTEKAFFAAQGLSNPNNNCFFNSVMQALIHCEPFLALLNSISDIIDFNDSVIFGDLQLQREKASRYAVVKSVDPREASSSYQRSLLNTPVLTGLLAFSKEYELGARARAAQRFYKVVLAHPTFDITEGNQEDAQEFLSYLLDTLEKEFDLILKPGDDAEGDKKASSADVSDQNWTQVGKNNKKSVEQQAGRTDMENPIFKIFGGKLRSELRKSPRNPPSVTIENFQQVCVDISSDSILSVQDAIEHMLQKEILEFEEKGQQISATKQLQFASAPPILLINLKRFTFIETNGELDFGKISKNVQIGDLRINVGNADGHYGSPVCRYTPFAIIKHHGGSATQGHYTAEVKIDSEWYETDDEFKRKMDESISGQEAYLIFYERRL